MHMVDLLEKSSPLTTGEMHRRQASSDMTTRTINLGREHS